MQIIQIQAIFFLKSEIENRLIPEFMDTFDLKQAGAPVTALRRFLRPGLRQPNSGNSTQPERRRGGGRPAEPELA